MNLTVTEEVNRLRKDQKEIQNNIELLINTSRTEIETIKNKSRDERVEKTNTDQQSQLTALSTRNIFKLFFSDCRPRITTFLFYLYLTIFLSILLKQRFKLYHYESGMPFFIF